MASGAASNVIEREVGPSGVALVTLKVEPLGTEYEISTFGTPVVSIPSVPPAGTRLEPPPPPPPDEIPDWLPPPPPPP
jgi:hypothetical protein